MEPDQIFIAIVLFIMGLAFFAGFTHWKEERSKCLTQGGHFISDVCFDPKSIIQLDEHYDPN
jgi:hypothetical protein